MTQQRMKAYARVIARAWTEPEYLNRLESDPKTVLSEAGLNPADDVHVHKGSDEVTHFVLPKRPAHLSDDDLNAEDPHPDICCHA
jgi:hypothetical protein